MPCHEQVAEGAGAAGPLAATQSRLRRVDPDWPDQHAVRVGVPEEPGWLGLDDVLADGTVAAWWRATLADPYAAGVASVAAVRLISVFGYAVLTPVLAGLVLDRRAYDVSAANLAVRLDEAGYHNATAVRATTVAVLPDDPAAHHPDAVVLADEAALLGWVADRAVAVLRPAVQQVRALSRFGVVPQWNVLADAVLRPALQVPLNLGGDQGAGLALGHRLLDALVDRGARVRRRGSSEELARGGRTYALPVRGSCCFYYRTGPPVTEPGGDYRATCPLLPPDLRTVRLATWLDTLVLHRPTPS